MVCVLGHSSIFQASMMRVEAALGRLDDVQTRLNVQEQDILNEIKELEIELRKEQDPSRMQLIQEMISVCSFL